jgi:two-component system, sensor histidine kinase and response regulator
VRALQAHDYDLVFMDCHMPEMDGFEATAEIRRQEPANRRVPIIAMTASALPEDQLRCLAVGMDDYLTKPLNRSELTAVLDRWLHARDTAPAAKTLSSPVSRSLDSSPLAPESLHNLRRLGGTNRGFFSEIIDVFLTESVERLAHLSESAAKGELKAVQRIAHTHRGAALNFGARQMAQLCEELENATGAKGQSNGGVINEIIAQIEREFFRVRRALEAERASVEG